MEGTVSVDYHVLAIGLSDKLFIDLKERLAQYKLRFIVPTTIIEASCLLNKEIFHLLIIDLEYLRNIQQSDWLSSIRRISYVPVVILTDTPELDMNSMIELGMDLCVSDKQPRTILADMIYAQLRRYTEYNHYYKAPRRAKTTPFRLGDILIDPLRYVVEVQDQAVNLRPREFLLLLYFMQNPDIVLSSEQICEQAWNLAEGYDQGVAHPVYLLRKKIEPDLEHPVYIHTVRGVGYRFTPNKKHISHQAVCCPE